ncbi:hypothetical protein HMJ29_06600 [Hymenobacter taeanensis]|uniref:Uncharacterized protein n=1 Tax=Hymenobacter taeanensis TaxID=2735321 RepID=A0A6M6BFX2_9BACT|nr:MULTISPECIES: hypothetical protein [Hymenobacter]QJX46624.1 hypothetical protein HMJ29_06600 [Hymenobacter taeanensis]UOQ80487.1 hypothetical protein MUN83_16940 [Hymenobacter sp. 5414T-23]
MVREIVERDGRYFVQCSDGEYETTVEEIQQFEEGGKRMLAYLELRQKMYGHKNWTVGTTPPNTDFHVILALFFQDLKKYFQEKYHAGESLWTAYKMCDMAILEGKESLLNPYAETERTNAWIGRWQTMKEFLDLFPKRGVFDETPPTVTPITESKPIDTIATQPAGEPVRLIRKYYSHLGKHLPSPTLPELAGEWYSDLSRIGKEGLEYYVTNLHERASNKAEFLACLAILLAEVEQHAHLPGYGYRQHYPLDYLTPERECEIEASGRAALQSVREWHTLASLSPIEQFLDRARKIELWQNERHQLATRKDGHEEWNEEYGVMLLALQRAVPTAKKKLLRAAYTELKRLLPTIKASRPLKWQRLYDDGQPFFSSSLTAAYAYSEFAPLRPTQNTTDQISEFFFQYLHIHLFEKEWHVWQALILLAGALGEPAPPTPETFQEKQIQPTAPALDTPALTSNFAPHLLNYTLPELTALLTALGLVDTRKQATPAATPGAWVGVIYALIDEKRPRLKGSKAAIGRAFSATFGAVVSERAIQTGLGTRESEADQFKNRALVLLNT